MRMLLNFKKYFGTGPFAMLAASLFFSGMAAMVKVLGQDLSVFQITFFRSAVSAVIIFAATSYQNIPLKGKNQRVLWVRATAGFTAMCLNFYAISKIRLGDAAVLHQTTPFFVMLFSFYLLKEKIQSKLLIFTLLGFFGIGFILRPTISLFNLGGWAALLSAVFAATAYVSVRYLHRTDSFWTMAFYFMVVSSLLSLPLMLVEWKTPSLEQFFLLMGAGLLGTLGQLLMTFAYKHEEASWIAPFAYSGVLFSFLWGVLFFAEIPRLYSLIGGMLTIAGGLGILKSKKRESA